VITVLVVHCDRGDVAWLKDCLEKAGFRIVVAQDSRAGLDLARRESPELILLNLTPLAPVGHSGDDLSGQEMVAASSCAACAARAQPV
jgi:CheY-like chemotaxis protein